MNNNVKKVAVVGGGTAGFVAALILKRTYPTLTVDVIRSKKIGTIGVGEGSTEHWSVFMDYVGIQTAELINECDSTFKTGIMFEDWATKPYLQSVHDPFVADQLGVPIAYAKLIGENVDPRDLTGDYLWDNMTPFNKFMEERPNDTGVSQYHFNTKKLNDFLTRKAEEMGCTVVDDEITDVVVSEWNKIESISSEKEKYEYDFYVDCTGFAKLLIGQLGAQWQSYSKYLKMKEAIVFPTPEEDEIPLWTLAKAMNAGWLFRIPVQGRKGNGYIFDSDFITAEEAQREAESYLGHGVEVAKNIKFDPGALDRPWISNVCAIGLSASFVEPLEASSIGTSINQSFLLAQRIVNYNQESIDRYNAEVGAIMDNIRDFIALHYITDRRDTPFWQEVATTPLPESLEKNLRMWKTRMPTTDDMTSYTRKVLFNEYNYAIVMHGLGLFDNAKILQQYEMMPEGAKQHVESSIQHKLNFDRTKTIPHKLMLQLLRRLT
jgi:flavin-dependent dehydrogenase